MLPSLAPGEVNEGTIVGKGRWRRNRRLLRDGPLVAMTVLPLAFLAYAWHRRLDLDAFEPRVFLLPVFFALVARTLHLLFAWATADDAPVGRRVVLVAWAALATACALGGFPDCL